MRRLFLPIVFPAFAFLPVGAQGQVCLGATQVYNIDFESGAGGWTQAGTNGSWALTGARFHSASTSVFTPDSDAVGLEAAFSPLVAVPLGPTRLRFWQWQEIEAQVGDPTHSCYDGAVIEISTEGGGDTYQRLEDEITTNPYDGLINPGSGNELGDQMAWCGDPRDWTETIVDLTNFSGNDIHLKLILSSDSSIGREGWYVDDITIETCDPAADALVAYYPFDGETTDFSGSDRDGTLQGAAGFAPGRFDDALDLTSTDPSWVDLPAGLLDGEAACSIAFWLNYDDLDPVDVGNFLAVFANDGFSSGDLHVNLLPTSTPPEVEFHVAGSERVYAPGPVPPTGWFHVAMTYDTVAMESRTYVGGELASIEPQLGGTLCGIGTASQIGAWDFDGAGSQDRFFKGLIDDVRVYDKALSAAEVRQLVPHVFSDDFESGDFSAWDTVVQ